MHPQILLNLLILAKVSVILAYLNVTAKSVPQKVSLKYLLLKCFKDKKGDSVENR